MDPYHFNCSANSSTDHLYHHSPTFDSILGSVLLALALLGTLFNLIVVLAVRTVTKKNCSKARLASSLLIFNLSLSDTVYSGVHLFSAITMLSGGREGGILDNTFTRVLCNLTGVLFNLTMRTSLWFLTMLTLIRYVSVMFPLKLPLLVTKRRVKTVAVSVWIVIFVLPLVPFTLQGSYEYDTRLSICIWHVANDQSFHTRVAIHLVLMVVPIVFPGLLIITLYLQIVWKVIQLKTVHYKLRSGKIANKVENLADEEKEEKEKENDKDLVEAEPLPPVSKSTSNSNRKKISLAISSWSSSISFLNRPLSIVELERIEKETEVIDQDLMSYAVSSLSRTTFNNQESDRAGVVAYYINRFIVKTAGNATFERIQSNSFTESRRSIDYEAEECPISLNYYDCQENPDISSSSWRFRRGSATPSFCEDIIQEEEEKVSMVEQGLNYMGEASPSPRVDMATVVAQAMKKFLNKDLEDIKEMGAQTSNHNSNSNHSDKSNSSFSNNNSNKPALMRRLSSFNEVAARCRSNSILEESVTSTSSQLSPLPKIVCVNGVCREVPVSKSSVKSFRVTQSPESSFRISTTPIPEEVFNTSSKEHPPIKSDSIRDFHPPLSKTNSLPNKLVCKEIVPEKSFTAENKGSRLAQSTPAIIGDDVPKSKPSLKKKILSHLRVKGNEKRNGNMFEKRIDRLDMRLKVIIQSAFYTLLMVTLFVICYMPWWLLSIDILFRLMGKGPMIDVNFTWYCNFLTISYSTILLSACCNPVIYFYFAYKQAMLDTLKLRYKRFTKGKMVLLKKKKQTRVNLNKAKSKL
ncbi:uncharacterized protein LOC134814086 [Bolinopsis microptera]|uniref:uncharacterized protein LOC134814086 n=1 Tax=Bolinopsis microptera TaxID=2820187 RepID=UPI00307ACF6F